MKLRSKIFIVFFSFIAACILAIFTNHVAIENDVKKGEKERGANFEHILDAASIQPTLLQVDFSKPISMGSPLIFGGVHAPEIEHIEAWDKLQEAGVTSIRTDFFLEYTLPTGITISDYKNNRNNVTDPKNWSLRFINNRKEVYSQAKKRGFKTIGIVSYAPKWLTYTHTEHGVPMDWTVYEDIIKKEYLLYRNYLDYVEIWNEPTYNYFLDVKGSGMTPAEAYTQIFYHAAKAIREVDHSKNDGKRISIGGPVGHNPTDTSVLEAILKEPKTKQYIDFISYHNYVLEEPSWGEYKSVLAKYNMQNTPIFLTEWNYDTEEKKYNPYKNSDLAIAYTGGKFLDFLKMGLAGANYYSFHPIDETSTNLGEGYMGFYKWGGEHAELLPQAKTWRILSKDMALGKGKSTIFESKTEDADINTVGFTNTDLQKGIAIVNASPSGTMVDIRFTNLGMKDYAKVKVYQASADNDASFPIYSGTLKIENNSTHLVYFVPAESIIALKLEEERDLFNIFNRM